ncbi:hypothetical protein PsorP6_005146 [Peronosclerospora sorghi]|uniref:Uncharacterized protein n=1 Tax=Peronosclerospora sorghi TaxID=230839 RepID=A0ACC0W0Y8_9STRA|nr:hypothetical protein PsorP6_005146 [Peronosclerospora sorghi]
MKATSSAKMDEILTLLTAAESHASSREVNVLLARGWLMLNIMEALESIPNEDLYFHPSRYLLARIVYWLLSFCSMLGQRGDQNDRITAFLEAARTHGRESKPEGPSVAATRALQAITPIFDNLNNLDELFQMVISRSVYAGRTAFTIKRNHGMLFKDII